jgi:hypothetical protein
VEELDRHTLHEDALASWKLAGLLSEINWPNVAEVLPR